MNTASILPAYLINAFIQAIQGCKPTVFRSLRLSSYLLVGWMLMAGMSSCQKPIDPSVTPIPVPGDPTTDPNGLVRPVGEPTGAPEVAVSIGPAGGTVKSEDGSLQIDIPAGALSGVETTRIEPITNTNASGKETAYRLEPHGIQFAKPAKLTFTYADNDLNGTVAEAFQVAYQNEQGVWMAMPGVKLNQPARTITVETTHFSDWSYFSSIYLSPQQRGIRPGESVQMQVYTTLAIDDQDVLLAPLVREQAVLQQRLLVELNNDKTVPVTQWALSANIGKLATTGAGPTNTYTAPTGIVKPTPVTVTARVKGRGDRLQLLLSSMMIMPEGLIYRLDGGPWVHRPGVAQRLGGSVITIGAAKPSSGDTGLAVSITIPGLKDTKNINLSWGPNALFVASPVENYLQYQGYYGVAPVFSPGSLIISDIRYLASNGGIETASVNGSFIVEKAGLYNVSGYVGAHTIEGYFCLGKAN